MPIKARGERFSHSNQATSNAEWRFFQPQPEGLGLFLRPATLSIAYVECLHCVLSALLDTKIAASIDGYEK